MQEKYKLKFTGPKGKTFLVCHSNSIPVHGELIRVLTDDFEVLESQWHYQTSGSFLEVRIQRA
jgi:hypothetical protein